MNDEDQGTAARDSDGEVLLVEGHGDTEIWRFNRPTARNALTPDLVARLRAELERAQAAGIRSVILAGNGLSFCTGADLKYLMDEYLKLWGPPDRAVGDHRYCLWGPAAVDLGATGRPSAHRHGFKAACSLML